MRDVFVVGVGQTTFGKHTERSHASLAHEAIDLALRDAGLDAAHPAHPAHPGDVGDVGVVDHVVFGSCAAGAFGQHSARGVHVLGGTFGGKFGGTAVTDVEAACATGFTAFDTAAVRVRAGDDVVVAVGVDKTYLPDPLLLGPLFAGALNQLDAAATTKIYDDAAASIGVSFAPSPARLLTLDVCALLAQRALQQQTTTLAALHDVAARAHAMAALNPKSARGGKTAPVTADAVAADKVALAPFTRAMCTGLADGAACVVVCSGDWLKRQSDDVQRRAIRVRATSRRTGGRASFDTDSVTTVAARSVDVAPLLSEVDVAEVHDATSYATVAALQALSLASLPSSSVNTSGGLIGKGHPLAATGLGMIHEVALQLRGEAGPRQVAHAKRGLVHNAGGFAGLDEAVVGVAVFDRA